MSSVYKELAERLRRTDLLLLRAVRRQRARPAMRAKGQFWGSVITDDEVDALLQAHGEIDLPPNVPDGLEVAVQASARRCCGNAGQQVMPELCPAVAVWLTMPNWRVQCGAASAAGEGRGSGLAWEADQVVLPSPTP